MSSFCGAVDLSGEHLPPGLLEAMAGSLNYWTPDKVSILQNGNVGMAHLMSYSTPESVHEVIPLSTSKIILTGDYRIYNREELSKLLEVSPTSVDSVLIEKSYERWGENCAQHLVGDFAFVIWDSCVGRLFCCRDQIGIQPLYYAQVGSIFAFSTEIKALFQVPGLAKRLNDYRFLQTLTEGVLVTMPYSDETHYESVFQLTPAHSLVVTQYGSTKQKYWELDPRRELRLSSEAEYVEGLREQLYESVRCRARSAGVLGAELSGGLDSSVISALAVKFRPDLHTITNVPSESNNDFMSEAGFATELCDYAGITNRQFVASENFNFESELRQIVHALDGPLYGVWHLLRMPTIRASEAKSCNVILSGFGGDECVSNSGKSRLYELGRAWEWGTLFREVCGANVSVGSVKEWLNYVLHGTFPKFMAWYNRSRDPSYRAIPVSLLRHEAFQRVEAVPSESFPSFMSIYSRPVRAGVRWSCYERISGSLSEYIRSVTCSLSIISKRSRYVFPLLDTRLLSFALSIPAEFRYRNGRDRYIMREAMKGLVPEKIRLRKNKAGYIAPGAYGEFLKKLGKEDGSLCKLPKRGEKLSRKCIREDLLRQISRAAFLNKLACERYFMPIGSE